MKKDKKLSLWEKYLTTEIGIEFKSCLYFFAILFFYCVYRIIGGSMEAGIIHMGEMILTCYAIGYMQVYLFGNFDEAENLGVREIVGMVVCTALYTAVSILGGWFDRTPAATVIFVLYVVLIYVCVVLIYRTKRKIDDKKLNDDLKLFQSEHKK